LRDSPALSLIDENGVRAKFGGERDRVRFAWVKSYGGTNCRRRDPDSKPLGWRACPLADLRRGARMRKLDYHSHWDMNLAE
jgi:hypothetical protein